MARFNKSENPNCIIIRACISQDQYESLLFRMGPYRTVSEYVRTLLINHLSTPPTVSLAIDCTNQKPGQSQQAG